MYDGIDYRGHWVTSARGGRTAEGNLEIHTHRSNLEKGCFSAKKGNNLEINSTTTESVYKSS